MASRTGSPPDLQTRTISSRRAPFNLPVAFRLPTGTPRSLYRLDSIRLSGLRPPTRAPGFEIQHSCIKTQREGGCGPPSLALPGGGPRSQAIRPLIYCPEPELFAMFDATALFGTLT
jgi:hypothetical protein